MSLRARSAGPVRGGLLLILCLGWVAGCEDYSEVRASLDSAQQERFDRGRREATPCWTCHDVTGQGRKTGPPLGGFFGRRAGSAPGYPYSPALQAAELTWNAQTLDAFLRAPQEFIPGNRMLSTPLIDSRRRADLIFFLTRVSAAPEPPERVRPN